MIEDTDFTSYRLGRLRSILSDNPANVDLAEFINLAIDPNIDEERIEGILLYHMKSSEYLFTRVLSVDQTFYWPAVLFTRLLAVNERYGEAMSLLDSAIMKTAYNPQLAARFHNLYAEILRIPGKYNDALTHLNLAISLDRTDPRNYIEQARTFYCSGQEKKSLRALRTAVALMSPGSEVRSILKHVLKGEEKIESLFGEPPSYGSLLRFMIFGGKAVREVLQSGIEKSGMLQEGIKSIHTSPYVERIMNGEDCGNVMTGIESDSSDLPADTDAFEWKAENLTDVLEQLSPGFELQQCSRYFDDRCSRCTHSEAIYAVNGLGNCPFDSEFKEYMNNLVTRIAEEIKKGKKVEDISELSVEQKFREMVPRRK